jgi:hypothetical protein
VATKSTEDPDLIQTLVAQMDKRIRIINKKLEPFEALIEQRKKIEASRRALLSERAPTNGGGRGLTQEEVVNWMRNEEGLHTVYEIAQGLGANEAAVRSHLSRGKDERFTQTFDGNQKKWELREPENDAEEDDEE